MKRVMMGAILGLALVASAAGEFETGGRFSAGCNYWASHAGMLMWRDWDASRVEKDFDLLSAHGMTMLRVFPLWPDFQPLTAEYGIRGTFRNYRQAGEPLANPACVDETMMARFRFMCDAADKRGIKLVVGLITGWMSSRMFAPPALETKNVLADPEAIKWEVRFVRHFVREMKDHRAIAAWDLGNECDCMGDVDEPQMWNWINTIASAIRLEDTTRPVVSGLHGVSSQENRKTNARQHGELLDVMTTHPYPLWTPNCNLSPFDRMRNGCHAACETVLYGDMTGKPAFVEEAGSMGPGITSEEHAAATMRTSLFSSWANGIPCYLWWCAFDQDRLTFAPYRWTSVERELGLFTADDRPKPAAVAMRDFTAFLKTLPFDRLPARRKDAVVVLSEHQHEWIKAQGAWLLARRAGIDISYALAESEELPEAPLYILPASNGYLEYTREAFWRVVEQAKRGATVLITLGNGAVLSNLREVAGVKTEDCYQGIAETAVEIDGVKFAVRENYVRILTPDGARVLAADATGNPALTVRPFGKGKILYFNAAIETKAQDVAWPVYRVAAREAGIRRVVENLGPDRAVGFTEHPAADGTVLVVAVNYEPRTMSYPVRVDGVVGRIWNGKLADGTLEIGPNDGCVFEVRESLARQELENHLKLVADEVPYRFVFARPEDAPEAKPFESRYRVDGDTVWFWGDDSNSGSAFDWGDNRGVVSRKRNGTLFAVELFLERELGIRWLWPGEDGTVYKKVGRLQLPKHAEGSFVTALDKGLLRNYRGRSTLDWGAVAKYVPNLPPVLGEKTWIDSLAYRDRCLWQKRMRLQDREFFSYGHAFTDWKARFGKTHPEYLNLTHGVRGWHGSESAAFVHLCVSNEAVVDQIIADWCAAGTNKYLNVCENDGSSTYCECPSCTALDVPDADPNAPVKHKTDRQVNFWNRIARKATKIRPDVVLTTYLYNEYRLPPRRERIEFPDNLLCGTVPSPIEDTAAMYDGWFKAGLKRFFLRPNHHHWLGWVPRGYEKHLYDEFHDCLKKGMTAVDYDAPATRQPMAIEFYVTARMIADPTLPFEEIVSEYYSGYGEAAPEVRAYFEAVRAAGDKARAEFDAAGEKLDHSQLAHKGRPWQIWGRTEEDLREKKAILDEALAKHGKTMDPQARRRLESLVLQNEHAIVTFRFLDAQDRGFPKAEKDRLAKELVDFRVKYRYELPEDYFRLMRCWWGEVQSWRDYKFGK